MTLREVYAKEVRRQLGGVTVWPLETEVAPGDVGTMVDGTFEKSGTLVDLGIEAPVEAVGSAPMKLATEGVREDGSEVGTKLFFASAADAYVRAEDVAVHKIAHTEKLAETVLRAHGEGRWRSGLLVVLEATVGASTTVLASQSTHARAELDNAGHMLAAAAVESVMTSQRATLMLKLGRVETPLFKPARFVIGEAGTVRGAISPWRKRLGHIADRPLLDLAIVPVWTPKLARAAELTLDLAQIEALRSLDPANDWTAETTGEETEEHRRYWLPAEARSALLRELTLGDTAEDTVAHVASLARRLRAPDLEPAAVPEPTRRWAELAAAVDDPAQFSQLLDDKATQLIRDRAVADLTQWIESARSLQWVADVTVRDAVERVARRVELDNRRRDDDEQLDHYLDRPALDAAFFELLSDDERWALHYVGGGGVGKTMFARHLCSQLVPSKVAFAARVDFDHLDPAYPEQDPGLLLTLLAEELRLHDTELRAESAFRSLLEARNNAREHGDKGVRSIFAMRAIDAFAHAVRTLGKMVVIVLDTCEELARTRPADEYPRALEDTFYLLNEVKVRAPNTRVVLLGRRLVADAGAGWRRSDIGDRQPVERRYLRLFEVRGLDRDEVVRMVSKWPCDALQRPSTIDRLVSATEQPAEWVGGITWEEDAEPSAPSARCAPWAVAMLAGWVADDPTTATSVIGPAWQVRYIENRVVRRLRDESLRALLPAMAALGRFDAELLRVAAGASSEGFDDLFARLSRFEWVVRDGRWRRIQPALVEGLRTWAEAHRALELAEARERAIETLERTTSDTTLRPDPIAADLLLELLADSPRRAAVWWARLEARLAAEAQWGLLARVAELALGSSCRAPERPDMHPHPLRAAVLATRAAAKLHADADADEIAGIWREVESFLAFFPRDDEPGIAVTWQASQERLRVRCATGLLRAGGTPQYVTVFSDEALADHEVSAALLGALDARLDAAEMAGSRDDIRSLVVQVVSPRFLHAVEKVPLLSRFAQLLVARVSLAAHDDPGPLVAFAEQLPAGTAADPSPSANYLDWVPPKAPLQRFVIEVVQRLWPKYWTAARALHWLEERSDAGARRNIDEDRALSLRYQLQAATSYPAKWTVPSLVALEGRAAAVHGTIDPSYVAETYLRESTHDAAMTAVKWLEQMQTAMLSRSAAAAEVRTVARARVLLRTLLRLDDGRPAPTDGGLEGAELARSRLLGLGPRVDRTGLEGMDAWRWFVPVSTEEIDGFRDLAKRLFAEPQSPVDELDRVETDALLRRWGAAPAFVPPDPDAWSRWLEWCHARPEEPWVTFDIVSRGRVLLGAPRPDWFDERVTARVGALGLCRALERAGEVLALRVPFAGAEMLLRASNRYGARDRFGAWRCAVSAALAGCRARHRPTLQTAIARARETHYPSADIASFELLEKMAGSGDDLLTNAGPLRNWLRRLVAALAFTADDAKRGDRCARLWSACFNDIDRQYLPADLRWLDPVDRGSPELERPGTDPLLPNVTPLAAAGGAVVIRLSSEMPSVEQVEGRSVAVKVESDAGIETLGLPALADVGRTIRETSRLGCIPTTGPISAMRIRLALNEAAAGFSWEALFLGGHGVRAQGAYDIARQVRSHDGHAPAKRARRPQTVAVALGGAYELEKALPEAWRSAGAAVLLTQGFEQLDESDCVHLVVQPIRTSLGLHVVPARSSSDMAQISMENAVREGLSAAEWLAKRLRRSALVALQLPPVRELRADDVSLRLAMADLRRFAHNLAEAGVCPLVVLPTMTETTFDAVARFAHHVMSAAEEHMEHAALAGLDAAAGELAERVPMPDDLALLEMARAGALYLEGWT